MKRLIAVSLLALCLSSTTLAGDVPFPGKQEPPPPPCTENCTSAATTPDTSALDEIIIEIVLTLSTLLP